MILVAPFIITWVTGQNVLNTTSPRRLTEAVLVVLALVVCAWLLFGPFTVAEKPVLLNYMLFPLLIWLAFRYSPRGMIGALLLLATIAIWNTLQGYGIFAFAGQTVTERLVQVQMLLNVLAFSGLLLSVIVSELNQAHATLRQSEDKFRYVFDNSPIGKSITLPAGEISVNRALCQMLGYSQEELAQRTWQEITHPQDREATQNMVNALLSGQQESARFTKRYLHKDGSAVWAEVSTALRRDSSGKPLYFMTAILDINAQVHAEEALRKSEARPEGNFREQCAVLYAVRSRSARASHEPDWQRVGHSPLRPCDPAGRCNLRLHAAPGAGRLRP